ncbi:VCBS repeat-containing protein [Geminicoccaceae bacterium SYSU G07066]|uniref:VCBS repeat-containing protein n=2 Tax=Benzoatithermus flavus TaxID=3108223 RepID=A0ABU8XKB6_9PROT
MLEATSRFCGRIASGCSPERWSRSLLLAAALGIGCLAFAQEAHSQPAWIIQNRSAGLFPTWATESGVEVLTGNFNRDRRTDLGLIRLEPGWSTLPVALATSASFLVQNRMISLFAGWATESGVQVLTGDFNRDGLTDVALIRQDAGWSTLPVALSTNFGFRIRNYPIGSFAGWATESGVQVLTGDFNGDRRTDVALVRQDAGWATVPLALSIGGGFSILNPAVGPFAGWATESGVQVLTGDFDGDRRTDIALVRQDAGWATVPLALSTGTGFNILNPSVGAFAGWATESGVQVLTGDFDGDGRTDLALVRQDAGWNTIPLALSTGTGFNVLNPFVGAFASWATESGVQVVTGDFNGDRRTDIALVRQDPGWNTIPVALSTGSGFNIENRPAGSFAGWATESGVEVVTGDFNGDRRTDLALVRQDPGWSTVPVALAP